ncbi:MAG: N(6)-L-threonylcarbamoyladenine synthase Kae1 [Candidatus Bathyarchaeota archaeon]|nr:MAG: N(6)-L-threonylcarbamoyladenine synthase Kae1 [Candidatus Bathyarchaeota archaeon]
MTKKKKTAKICLGIESSADDFGVGLVNANGKVFANAHSTFVPETGGIHPREAARHHSKMAGETISSAFKTSGVTPQNVDVVAFSQGPGLGPCLRTGATAARTLASYLKIPLVGVNHCVAHIEIGKLATEAKDPVTLYVSGGNTIVSAFDTGRYRIFGETLDIAVGNCLDVFGREAGLHRCEGTPFGAAVENFAMRGKVLLDLPYSVKGMDLSFSGLLTAGIRLLKSGLYNVEDLCFSLQETVFSMLTEVTERALAHTGKSELLLTGGVAANKRLQSMLKIIADEHNVHYCAVPKQYALDNGVMIAWAGLLAYEQGLITPIKSSFARPKWRLDSVDIPWVKSDC